MTKQNSQIHTSPWVTWVPDRWSTGAAIIAMIVVLPILAVLWIAMSPSDDIWSHLMSTTLPRYLRNTAILVISVGALAAITGTVTAWLVTMYRFPGSRLLQWLLLLPLAIPAYIGAYALVDFLEYAGPIQSALRDAFGWQTAREYWFPEVRSRAAAALVLASVSYPYVFLLVRAALREQSASTYEVAQALGAGGWARFWRIGLPLARPAIAAGTAIVMMETISDFGAVAHFSVQTLTTGIFSTWLEAGNRSGAAQIASIILILVFSLAALEKYGRRRARFFHLAGKHHGVTAQVVTGRAGWAMTALCFLPFVVGFVLPVGVMVSHGLADISNWLDPDLFRAFANTVFVAGSAAVLTVIGAIFMVYGVRLTGRKLPSVLLPLTAVGYAAPGAVLALGLLVLLSRADHLLADIVQAMAGVDVGLLMTGSAFAVIVAYFVRFFAIAQGAADTALGRISPSIPMAARSLGKSPGRTLRLVLIPLIRGSIGTALLLVFVDCVKELPATLLLRPFNFNTLSTRVYDLASLEQISKASPAALLVISVGLVAVFLLAKSQQRTR